LLWWLMMAAAVEIGSDPLRSDDERVKHVEGCYAMIQLLQKAEKKSGCQIEKLLHLLK